MQLSFSVQYLLRVATQSGKVDQLLCTLKTFTCDHGVSGLVAREISDLVSDSHGPRLVGLAESRPDEHQCKIVAVVHNQPEVCPPSPVCPGKY